MIWFSSELRDKTRDLSLMLGTPFFMLGAAAVFAILSPDGLGSQSVGSGIAVVAWACVLLDGGSLFDQDLRKGRLQWVCLSGEGNLVRFVFARYLVRILWLNVWLLLLSILFGSLASLGFAQVMTLVCLVSLAWVPMVGFSMLGSAIMAGISSGAIFMVVMLPLTLAPLLFALLGYKQQAVESHVWLALLVLAAVSLLALPRLIAVTLLVSLRRDQNFNESFNKGGAG